jgi:predicted GNAT family acetyltransferase
MSDARSQIEVRDDPSASRYEAVLDGAVAGFAAYERNGDVVVFTHTQVDPAYGGQGIGTTIIEASLADVRAKGLTVTPVCPFYVTYFEKHPEAADLLA